MVNFPIPAADWSPQQWRDAFHSVLRWTATTDEHPDLILALGGNLGKVRAQAFNRGFAVGSDVAHALSIYCWWPFKPPIPAEIHQPLIAARAAALRSALLFFRPEVNASRALDPRQELPPNFYDAVQENAFGDDIFGRLIMSADQLYEWQMQGLGITR